MKQLSLPKALIKSLALNKTVRTLKKHKEILSIYLLIIAASIVYINILPNPFIWSEDAVIVQNETFKNLSYLPKFFTLKYWLEDHPFSGIHIFRPIRAVTFTLEYALFKLNPVPYHITNILLHTATTLIIYFIFKKITKSKFTAFLGSLFFALHPVHTETITWTMSRDDIMCTLFPLIAWWFFIKRIEHKEKNASKVAHTSKVKSLDATHTSKVKSADTLEVCSAPLRISNCLGFFSRLRSLRMTILYLALESFFFTLGLLSREMAAVFPFLLVFYVLCFYPRKNWRKHLLATLPYWLINAAYAFFHFYFWWEPLSAERFSIKLPLLNHALLVAKTIGFYLKLLLVPINLCADHYFPLFVTLTEADTQIAVAIFLLFAGLTLYFLSKNLKKLAFSLAFTILSFLPAANIIIITGRPVGEQRLYLPSIGFCLFLSLGLKKLWVKHNSFFSVIPNLIWNLYNKIVYISSCFHPAKRGFRRNNKEIYVPATKELKQNVKSLILTLFTLFLIGFYSYQTVMRNFDWRSSLALWESAVRASPKTERAHRNLAGSYLASGQEDKAIQEFETILNLQETELARNQGVRTVYKEPQPLGALAAPVMPVTNERKICEMREKMEKEAKVRMVSPNAEIHQYLGDAYKRRRDLRRAAYEYNMAIIYDPASFKAYNELGIAYDMAGFSEAAIFVLEKGTKIDSEFHPLYHNLGVAYEHLEKYKEAIESYEKVIELEPNYDQPHLRLSIIYAKHKIDKEKARNHWKKYLQLTRRPKTKYIEEMEELLK